MYRVASGLVCPLEWFRMSLLSIYIVEGNTALYTLYEPRAAVILRFCVFFFARRPRGVAGPASRCAAETCATPTADGDARDGRRALENLELVEELDKLVAYMYKPPGLQTSSLKP